MDMDMTDPPRGPYSLLRAIGTVLAPLRPHEVREIGWVDLIVIGADCRLGTPQGVTFGAANAGGRAWGQLDPCTRDDLEQAIRGPSPPDALVVHDLAGEQIALPASLTDPVPVISTYRVAEQAGLANARDGLEMLVRSRGLGPTLTAVPDPRRGPTASRTALLVAVLMANLLEDAAVRAHAMAFAAEAERLRPILGDMLGDPALHGMLRMSDMLAYPLRPLPGPWDDEAGWALAPVDDLRWMVASGLAAYCPALAKAELQRRARAGEPIEGKPRRVLLRRMLPARPR